MRPRGRHAASSRFSRSALVNALAVDATFDPRKGQQPLHVDRRAASFAQPVGAVIDAGESAFYCLARLSGLGIEDGNELTFGFDVDVVGLARTSCRLQLIFRKRTGGSREKHIAVRQ